MILATSLPAAGVSLSRQFTDTEPVAVAQDTPIVEVEDPTRQIPASPDGVFYVTPLVNGRNVRMVVDSGANMTILSRQDARALGLPLSSRAFHQTLKTAGGQVPIALFTIKHLTLAHRDIHDLRVAVMESAQGPSLLGHDVLSKFRRVSIADDVLQLDA